MKLRDLLPELEAACDELGPDTEVGILMPSGAVLSITGRSKTKRMAYGEGRPVVTIKAVSPIGILP